MKRTVLLPATIALAALFAQAATAYDPSARMLRSPDISADHVVFSFADDLWIAPREGGEARPLASPPGRESSPKFSPDGQTIAFVGNYDGGNDIYTIPIHGGIPHRVTHHPVTERLNDWTPDGESLVFHAFGIVGMPKQSRLFRVSRDGGLPELLPPPYGADGAYSADGRWLAYTPHSMAGRTWHRYMGGMQSDIWLLDNEAGTAARVTEWQGNDMLPMWWDGTMYYLTEEAPPHRLNIWSYDPETGKRHQVTRFEGDFGVKYPSIGPGPDGQGEIVFQLGSELMAVDLATLETRAIPITIPGARPTLRTQRVDAGRFVQSGGISPTGKRAVFEARGDIWTVPEGDGPARNLTASAGAGDRQPTWSPDGRWIAYISDADGEYDIWRVQSDGRGEPERLTDLGPGYRWRLAWSPDSRHIAFTDNAGVLRILDTGEKEITHVAVDPWARAQTLSWSHDSSWLAYTQYGDNLKTAIWLYDMESGETTRVTSGMYLDTWPAFDRKGDYLYFASQRDFSAPEFDQVDDTFVYPETDQLYVVPLRADVKNPFLRESDEESFDAPKADTEEQGKGENGEGEEDTGADGPNGSSEEAERPRRKPFWWLPIFGPSSDDSALAAEPDETGEETGPPARKGIGIDIDGFERRAMLLPVDSGGFALLQVSHEGRLFYARESGIKTISILDSNPSEQTVVNGTRSFSMSADGKRLLASYRNSYYMLKAAANQRFDKAVDLTGLQAFIDPRDEWRQIFWDAWRLYRDFFYDPGMHGVDWPRIGREYAAMVEDATTRSDINSILAEMMSELNVGHAYLAAGGDVDSPPRVAVAMLGVDFELHQGSYRIASIIEGSVWDPEGRGPLSQPGVDVRQGDYLHAINGTPLDTSKDPWAAFIGLAGKDVILTVGDSPTPGDDDRDVMVRPGSTESTYRQRHWEESMRAYADEKSGGRIGYIHVPDTSVNGLNNLVRQFYSQTDKEALIIDERWNSGGRTSIRFIELLNRPIMNYRTLRHGNDYPWPPQAHHGPKAMLINGNAGSGGDLFPYYFRRAGLGPLIGTRTWGGIVGLTGNPIFIDGGRVTVPTRAFYELDGTWGIEGHGVEPDIHVLDDPNELMAGNDPQMDAAIEYLLDTLDRGEGYIKTPRPAYPDRSGMGLPDDEK